MPEILQAVQMEQSPLYVSQFFGEVAVALTAEALEAENVCVPGGAVVGGEFGNGGVRRHHHIRLVRRLGGDAVICFCVPY